MLLFMDGMAHYASSQIGLKYSAIAHDACVWSVAAEGRYNNCLKRVSTSNATAPLGYVDAAPLTTRAGVWAPTSGGVCGFAVKIDDLTKVVPHEDGPDTTSLFAVLEGGNFHLKVSVNPSGTFSLVRAVGPLDTFGTVIANSSEGLAPATWAYVEFKWLLHDTDGSFEIRVNTLPVLTYSGPTVSVNPTWSTLTQWNAVRLLNLASQLGAPLLTVRLCDLYLADLTSIDDDDVDDFLGDGVIDTIIPNGVGTTTQWTPLDATPNWDQVNDRPAPDDDASYVSALDPDTLDTYHFEDIPTTAIVKGVHLVILARKEAEGSATIAPVVHQGGVDYVGPTQGVASPAYDRYVTQAYEINPATDAPWTPAEVNAGQFGVKKLL